jgi:hypothetical protein
LQCLLNPASLLSSSCREFVRWRRDDLKNFHLLFKSAARVHPSRPLANVRVSYGARSVSPMDEARE